jgi:cysteine dioxygenase
MSTEFAITTPLPSIRATKKRAMTLSELAGRLNSLEDVPSLEDLNRWLLRLELSEDCLRYYRNFKPSTYARNRVMKNEFVEMLVLCWRPAQKTVIHDHNGSHGAVRVCEGILWETMFEKDKDGTLRYKISHEWRSGGVTGADVPDIHILGNPEVSGQDLITIHIYAPPLGKLNTYKVGSKEVGSVSFDYYMDGAGI